MSSQQFYSCAGLTGEEGKDGSNDSAEEAACQEVASAHQWDEIEMRSETGLGDQGRTCMMHWADVLSQISSQLDAADNEVTEAFC